MSNIPRKPLLWLLLSERHGDNAQARALAHALRWSYEVKQIFYDHNCAVPLHKRKASLIGVDLEKTIPLCPPWPDIIIGSGRRTAPIARWIKKQSNNRTLLIQLGRVMSAFHHYDLIITSPHYALPAAPNVLNVALPISYYDPEALAAATAAWLPQFQHLPKPWTALFIGGETKQLRLDGTAVDDLLAKIDAYRNRTGGSLLISTSPRTPESARACLKTIQSYPHFLFDWKPDTPNPYLGILSLADSFIVTNDSISMIADAAHMLKPLYIHELPNRLPEAKNNYFSTIRRAYQERRMFRVNRGAKPDIADRLFDLVSRYGLLHPLRNPELFTLTLYKNGIAQPLEQESRLPVVHPEIVDGIRAHTVEVIKNLWAKRAYNA